MKNHFIKKETNNPSKWPKKFIIVAKNINPQLFPLEIEITFNLIIVLKCSQPSCTVSNGLNTVSSILTDNKKTVTYTKNHFIEKETNHPSK